MNTTVNNSITPPTYPARPVNGGPLEKAQPKHGPWLYEPKFNGWRALVHTPTGTMFNRKGERLSIAAEFRSALHRLAVELSVATKNDQQVLFDVIGLYRLQPDETEWVDCEALERRHNRGRGSLVLLDLPQLRLPLRERGMVLRSIFCPAIDHCAATDSVYSVPQFTDGLETYRQLKQDNQMLGCEFYEGVVAKRADSLYPIQLRNPSQEFPFWMKHRWQF